MFTMRLFTFLKTSVLLVLFQAICASQPVQKDATGILNTIKKEKSTLMQYHSTYMKALSHIKKDKISKSEHLQISQIALDYADFVMKCHLFKPSVKYPKALRLYEFAYKYNPKCKKSEQNIQLIKSIYKEMKRNKSKN